MTPIFDHEKLEVYQRSIEFTTWVLPLLKQLPKTSSLHDQLDRASISIPLNIAEGNGKWSKKDRCRYFDIAKGSAFECAAVVDILAAKELLSEKEANEGKAILAEIVRMLIGLIQANDPDRELRKGSMRVGESEGVYPESEEKEKD
ncbi:MAG: four helix bundle protein [Verrucomicrobiota bacterium]